MVISCILPYGASDERIILPLLSVGPLANSYSRPKAQDMQWLWQSVKQLVEARLHEDRENIMPQVSLYNMAGVAGNKVSLSFMTLQGWKLDKSSGKDRSSILVWCKGWRTQCNAFRSSYSQCHENASCPCSKTTRLRLNTVNNCVLFCYYLFWN